MTNYWVDFCKGSHMSSGAGSDSHRLDKDSILKEQPQQLNLDISVMSLPAAVSPSGCWGLVCLQRM